jgi:hypothetical protein
MGAIVTPPPAALVPREGQRGYHGSEGLGTVVRREPVLHMTTIPMTEGQATEKLSLWTMEEVGLIRIGEVTEMTDRRVYLSRPPTPEGTPTGEREEIEEREVLKTNARLAAVLRERRRATCGGCLQRWTRMGMAR